MLYVELLMLGISLSIDALTLAISIGASNLNRSKYKLYSLVVGIFHFFMPIIGLGLKNILTKYINIPENILFVAVITFIILGICLDKDKEITSKILNPFIFAFSVSIDSLSVGVSLNNKIILIASTTFMIISFIFTFLGFILGNKLYLKNSNKGKMISIVLLVVLLLIKLL